MTVCDPFLQPLLLLEMRINQWQKTRLQKLFKNPPETVYIRRGPLFIADYCFLGNKTPFHWWRCCCFSCLLQHYILLFNGMTRTIANTFPHCVTVEIWFFVLYLRTDHQKNDFPPIWIIVPLLCSSHPYIHPSGRPSVLLPGGGGLWCGSFNLYSCTTFIKPDL